MPSRNELRKHWISTVHWFRRIPVIHKPAKWLKDFFWPALVHGGLEFLRHLLARHPRLGPPTGADSVYQALRTNDPPTRGRILLHDQGNPRVTPDSLLALGPYTQHKQQPWPVFWSQHAEAALATASLALLLHRKTVCVESVYHYRQMRHDPAFLFCTLPPAVRLEGRWTSIVSRWVPCGAHAPNANHSHWLLDALPRLAFLEEFPADTRIIVPANLFAQHQESLALLGVLERCRFTTEHHLTIEEYYFSAPTAMLDCYNPFGIEFLRRSFLPKRNLSFTPAKRFFIKRSRDLRTATNEAELDRYLANLGWETVDTATLGFAEQIQLFHEAEAIVAFSGSALTNTVFCQPHCRVIGFIFDWALDSWIEWISQVVGFHWHAMIVRTDYSRQYRIDLKELEAVLIS